MGCAASTNNTATPNQQPQTIGGTLNTFATNVVQNTTLLVNNAFAPQQQQSSPPPAAGPQQHVQQPPSNPSQPIQAWSANSQHTSSPAASPAPTAQVSPTPAASSSSPLPEAAAAAVAPVTVAEKAAPQPIAEQARAANPPAPVVQSTPVEIQASVETEELPSSEQDEAAAADDEAANAEADDVDDSNTLTSETAESDVVQSGSIRDHHHPLQYFPQRYGGTFKCNICRQVGSGPAYACDPCGFDAHIDCFNSASQGPSSGIIAAHPHTLHYFPKRYNGNFVCNVCRKSGNGPCFACDKCGFDAHIDCFEKGASEAESVKSTPTTASSTVLALSPATASTVSASLVSQPTKSGIIAAHPHPLSYFAKRYNGGFNCNVCQQHGSGPAYACDKCGFDAHIACFEKGVSDASKPAKPAAAATASKPVASATPPNGLPKEGPIISHKHILSYFEKRHDGTFQCRICHQSGTGAAYACNDLQCQLPHNVYDAHVECFKKEYDRLMADIPGYAKQPDHATDMDMFSNMPSSTGTGMEMFSMAPDTSGLNNLLMQLGGGRPTPVHSQVDRAKVGKNFSSPLHAHPVSYLECTWASSLMSNSNCFDCVICGNQGVGAVLWCGPCNFGAHPNCFFVDAFESPQSKSSSGSEAPHPSPTQHVDKTDLELRARSTRWSSVHEHPLVYMPNSPHISLNGRYRCRVCDTDGRGPSWSCAVCALTEVPYCVHLHCFKNDGPGSDLHLAEMLKQLTSTTVEANHQMIESFVSREILPVENGPDGEARLSAVQLAASLAAFPYLKMGFCHPPLGVKAAPIWNNTNAQNMAHQYDVLYPIAKTFACDTDESAKQPLPNSLKVAVFFDLYKLQDWSVSNRMNTDMNVVVWRKILDAHASGKGFEGLKSEGILVTPIHAMPGKDCAFITHRWNGVQGIGGMSISLFQTFAYHMAIATGYKPEVQSGTLRPLYIWLDYLSVPQTSWNSAHSFSADEIAVRQRLNSKYIQFIGLEFGTIAKKSAYFINYVPLSFECNEDLAAITNGHKLMPLMNLLQSFDTSPNFYIQTKKFLTSSEQNWDPVDELEDWAIWQDRSYATRIWCVAEYSTVYLAGLGDRIKGAAQWYYLLLPIITGTDPSVMTRFQTVRDSYYTSDCLERSTKHAFAAWQDFNPQVQRREDPFRPMKLSAGQICQHFLSVEGLLMALAPAIATVKSDVPLVTDTMYRDILQSAWNENVSTLPSELRAMRNWILRQGRCGLDLPAILDDATDLKSDFLRAFQKQGIFERYFSYLGQFIRQGFNSMLWIDALLVWSAILQLPQQPNDPRALVDIDSILKPMPAESIPRGYRNAKYAYTWMSRTLEIPDHLIAGYFMPSYTSNGWSSMVALTEPIPFQFSNSAKPITTSFVKYLTPSHDPHDNSLSSFSLLSPSSSSSCGYQLLYKVRSSYTSSAKGVNQSHVILDGAVAVPRASLRMPDRFELSPSNAHESVDLNGSKLGLLMFTRIYPLERELQPGLQCRSDGIPQPKWNISNHAKEFKSNVIVAHSNI